MCPPASAMPRPRPWVLMHDRQKTFSKYSLQKFYRKAAKSPFSLLSEFAHGTPSTFRRTRRWQLRPWPSIHEGSRLVPRTVSPLTMALLNVTGDTDTPFHLFSPCVFAKALLFETVHRKGNHSTDVRNCWEEVVRTQFPPKSVASFQPTPHCPV